MPPTKRPSRPTPSSTSRTIRRSSKKKVRRERMAYMRSHRTDCSQKRGTETPYSEKSDHEKFYSSGSSVQPRRYKKKRKLAEVRRDDEALKKQKAKLQGENAELQEEVANLQEQLSAATQDQQQLKGKRKLERRRHNRQLAASKNRLGRNVRVIQKATKVRDENKGKNNDESRKLLRSTQRQRARAVKRLTKETEKNFRLTNKENAEVEEGMIVIQIHKVIYQCLKNGDASDDEEEEKGTYVYDAISDAGLTREQARRVVAGVCKAGVGVTAKGSENHTRKQTADAAKELELELRTNGTVASALRAVASSLELQHLTADDFADGELLLVPIFSWDAWPVCKTGARTFPCSTFAARVLVVRKRSNKQELCEVVNYGFIDEPRALAVFARLVAPDREQCILDNDCGVEVIIKQYFDAARRGDSFRLNLELYGVEAHVPVAVMWRCFDAKAARDFSDHRDATHCTALHCWLRLATRRQRAP